MRLVLCFALSLGALSAAGCARGDDGPEPRTDSGVRMDAGAIDGSAIDAPPPLPCGRETAACCSGTCDPGLECLGGSCLRTGDAGPDPTDSGPEPLDSGPGPIDGGPTPIDSGRDAGRDAAMPDAFVPDGGAMCGVPPLPCCVGSTCMAPYACVAGSCTSAMPDAGADAGTPCGMSMQPCCGGTSCMGGLSCVSGTCMPMTGADAGTDAGEGPPCGFGIGVMCCPGMLCFPPLRCTGGICNF